MKRYGNIDGLRTIAALGVVLMHVRANIGYKIVSGGGTDYLINQLVPQLSSYVYLFFIISGFAMCCGYYERIKNNGLTTILICLAVVAITTLITTALCSSTSR